MSNLKRMFLIILFSCRDLPAYANDEPIPKIECQNHSYSTTDTIQCLLKKKNELSATLQVKESAAMAQLSKDSSTKHTMLAKQIDSWNQLKQDQCELLATVIEGSGAEPERLRCELFLLRQQTEFLDTLNSWEP